MGEADKKRTMRGLRPSGGMAGGGIITPMRRDVLRTLLVVSDRPHPWAFLRDRLPGDLVAVAWTRPDAAGAAAAGLGSPPWMLAGTGTAPAAGLEAFRGRLFACRWIGPAPPGLPAPPVAREDWREVAADAERALAACLAGLRLAPGGGLVLPGGGFLPRLPELEALLSAHPDGLPAGVPDRRVRERMRRLTALLARHGLPLRVGWRAGRLVLDRTDDDRPA